MRHNGKTTLLLSFRYSDDNQLLWRAANDRGWAVERVRGDEFPHVDSGKVVLYIGTWFAPNLAKHYGLKLEETPDDWLPGSPLEYTRRRIQKTTIAKLADVKLPAFIKSPNEKIFPAKVCHSPADLPSGVDLDLPVLVSEPVSWQVEFRCFCLDKCVRAISPYFRNGKLSRLDGFHASEDELRQARIFAERVLQDERVSTPRAIVLDVGLIENSDWAVVEANGAWGSGIYGCDPEEVLNVIEHAVSHIQADEVF